MQIQNIYPPMNVNNILDASVMKALNRASVRENLLSELNAGIGLMDTRVQFPEGERDFTYSEAVRYDMFGGLRDDGLNPPGNIVDTYA